MNTLAARTIIAVALASFASHRRGWAEAMRAEFDVAIEDGTALSFAIGCLVTAWRDLPASAEGRLIVSRYTLAVLVILPLAGLLLVGSYFGYPYDQGSAAAPAVQAKAASGIPLFNDGNRSAVNLLTAMLLGRVVGLSLLAWCIVERRWQQVGQLECLGASITVTFTIFSVIIMADWTGLQIPALVLAIELFATAMVRRWHGAEAGHVVCWKE